MKQAAQQTDSLVTVQVTLPNDKTKAGSKAVDPQEDALDISLAAAAELDWPSSPSSTAIPSCHPCSSCLQRSCRNELLVLFLLGWLFLPLWWAGAVMGFLRGRRTLAGTHKAAWHGCMVMSVVGTALLLALAIHYGPGDRYPSGLQEYYLALSGPAGSLPDLHSNASRALFATALHTTLELPQSYPASNILTRLVLPAPTATTPAGAGRHLLLSGLQEAATAAQLLKRLPRNHLNPLVDATAGSSARGTRELLQTPVDSVDAVLGVTFPPGPGLPSDEVLAALLVRSSTMRDLAGNLAAAGFVAAAEDVAVALSDSKGYRKEVEPHS